MGGRVAVAHVEESKIIAEIEDIKTILVRAVHQTGTKTGAEDGNWRRK